MVSVPVAEMLDLPMAVLDVPENALLIFSVLKEAHGRATCLRPRLDDAGHVHHQLATVFVVCSDHAAPRLILVEAIARVENGLQRNFRHDDVDIAGGMKFHWESPLPQIRHPCCG